ncbi:MAG: hypothetical protein L6V81_05730 [Clostridium sp.]|nr:MAG: hypothetical protein L6V81_05730 [Clostridium sp.]
MIKESKVEILSTTSTSIDEAIKELSKLTNKKVFIPHLKVLIITDNILKEDIDYYDYFLRNSKVINELLCLLYRFKKIKR